MQMYGDVQGFPYTIALFGLVIHHEPRGRVNFDVLFHSSSRWCERKGSFWSWGTNNPFIIGSDMVHILAI